MIRPALILTLAGRRSNWQQFWIWENARVTLGCDLFPAGPGMHQPPPQLLPALFGYPAALDMTPPPGAGFPGCWKVGGIATAVAVSRGRMAGVNEDYSRHDAQMARAPRLKTLGGIIGVHCRR